jgi:hypothetical protein
VICEYYRRLHCDTSLKVALLQILQLDLPDLPVYHECFTVKDTHAWTGASHTGFHLDIRALEMVSVDQLVDQIYEDKLIKQDLHGFVTRVPILCAYFHTPLFQTTQAKYYKWLSKPSNNAPTMPKFPRLPRLPFMR